MLYEVITVEAVLHRVVHLAGEVRLGAVGQVATESFTGSSENAKWQQYPFSLKAQGDWIYTLVV